jgi:uncharacterized protein with PIN domain
MKVLVDEMLDGWDLKLQHMGHDAHSMKKIKAQHDLDDDNSMIGYALKNDMVLVTKDTGCGRNCEAVGVRCILLDDVKIFKMCLEELDKLVDPANKD